MNVYVKALDAYLNDSFDIIKREIYIKDKKATMFYLSSLTDSILMETLVEGLVVSGNEQNTFQFYPSGIETKHDVMQACNDVLSGQCVVILEHQQIYYCIETRSYPSRNNGEPSVEQSIRGAHDGFVENIILNVGLLRRRIRDPKLLVEIQKVGQKSKTDIVIAYISDRIDQNILQDFQKRLVSIQTIDILNERDLIAKLYGNTWNPYPHVRYSERPDIASIHVLKGYLVVLVDNSPSAIILPTTFFELCTQIEEYTQTPIISFFTKGIRMIGVLFSIYLLPLWVALIIDHNPTMLNLPMQNIRFYEFVFQILFAEIVVEWIRQTLIHTPSLLSGIMSFIAVFVLGDMAIELGAYTQEILIMISIVNIGTLLTPSYELSLANKFTRIILSIIALWFGTIGFIVGIFLHFILLLKTETISMPYLYPFIPFSFQSFKQWISSYKK